jgi:hypothetical protein
MRLFHAQVYDENIEGTTALYTDPSNNGLFGSVEELSIFAVADTVSGTTPTLTVQIEESADQIHWVNKIPTAEINAQALSLTVKTVVVGRDNGSVPSSGFLRLRVSLGGTTPKAHVRLWVTGRGEQPV